MRFRPFLVVALLSLAHPALAAGDVVIGAIYPGSAMGAAAREAVGVALDIVNGQHAALPMLMGDGGGLDRLGHAQLRAEFADDGDDPAKAAAAAERLLSQNHAVALIGGVSDATIAAISQVAERHGVPYLALDTGLGNKDDLSWFFRIGRTTARDAAAALRLLVDLSHGANRTVQSVAIVYEDTLFGRDSEAAQRKYAGDNGLTVAADLKVAPDAADFVAEADALARAKPDAILCSLSPAATAALLQALSRRGAAAVVVAQGAGLRDPAVTATLGPLTAGLFNIGGYAADPVQARPAIAAVDALYRARTGRELNGFTARELTGTLLLADVVNRAASTVPIDLRTALMATDTPGDQTLMLWDGIRFDDSGQNVLATPALMQFQAGAWRTVAPATIATAQPVWPAKP